MLAGPNGLSSLYLTTAGGQQTPLSAVARIEERTAPLRINHVAQFPAATISFDTAPGVSIGSAVSAIDRDEKAISVPASITTVFLGAANAFKASLGNELWLILAAIVTVYIVLGVLYESYVHPVTILSTLPSAGAGALLALMIAGQDLGVIGIIGIILLIGIVKKNAIMMIDFALDAERNEGKSPAGGDPSGGAAALPPDHHDHPGRPVRRASADAGLGRGIGAAPSAGHQHRRRTGGQPAADPLHHAGHLSRLRPPGAALRRGASNKRKGESDPRPVGGASRIPGRSPREPLGALHSAPDRHRPADARHRPGGHRRLFLLPVSPAAAGGLPDHLGQRLPARRQSRDHGHQRGDAARAKRWASSPTCRR